VTVSAALRRSGAVLLTLTLAVALSIAPAATAQIRDITLTLARHAQSAGNASGLIDSSVPGPDLTAKGRCEADAVTALLRDNDYDGIYASTMVRTQQTAQPMADALHEPIVVLPGLREIEAGVYEGQPEADAADTYFRAPLRWLSGDLGARIPGSVDGNEFDHRFDEAVQAIYDGDGSNAVAYSHGGAITLWLAMNVRGVDLTTLQDTPLQNTGYFVVHGNPAGGWDLVASRPAP
jgi:broad specificity phosphatase PhoE